MELDPGSVDPTELYKLQIQIITPRPIAWVSTVSADGVRNLAPFSFSSGIGTHPPAHLFCPTNRGDGTKKDTLRNVEATGEYVVGVVPYAVREAMNQTSADYPPGVDEFVKAGLTPVPSLKVKPPRIKESPINMECRVLKILHLGEGPHGSNVVIGEILHIHIDNAILRNGKIDPDLVDTIGRMSGPEYCRTTERFEMLRPKM
ncbi:MAG: flavin reductase family protein [Deltaproteobacteria bacterium]|nr:flavin reductase family protein [Deltaproteobacteria bacterium]